MRVKILILSLFSLFLSINNTLKSQVIFSESFEGNFPPTDWQITTLGGGSEWSVVSDPFFTYSGNSCMIYQKNFIPQANTWAFTKPLPLLSGVKYRLSYWYSQNIAGGAEKLKVTIGTNASIAAQTTIIHDYQAINNQQYIEGVDNFTVPSSGNYNIAFNCYSDENSARLVLDSIVLMANSDCVGTPAVGIVTGPTLACPGAPFTLHLSGFYFADGLSLQWQSSFKGENSFTNIDGANAISLNTTQATAKDYRCVVTCTNGSATSTSNTISVENKNCYCIPTTYCTLGHFTNVSFSTINNNSLCLDHGYGDYSESVPPAIVKAGTSVPISLTIYSSGNNNSAVWIDYNQNGVFEPTEYTYLGYTLKGNFGSTERKINSSVFIPSNAFEGKTRMRVMMREDLLINPSDACLPLGYGETEDYTLTITPAKVAILFTPSFTDTLYTQKVTLTAQIKQSSLELNITDSLKPRLWVKTYDNYTWKPIKGELISGTANNGFWQFEINHDSLKIRRNGCDSVQFYFVAQDSDTSSNLGYLPESGVSHTNVQQQISPPVIPFGYRLKPRLRDTIYVGGSNCRYQSLSGENGLFQHINTKLLETDLTVIIDGDMSETGKYGLTKTGLNGHRMAIRPDSNIVRTLEGYYDNTAILQLNGVKNILVNGSFKNTGRYLRFLNKSNEFLNNTDTASNIKIFNSCDSIILNNLIFEYKSKSLNIGETSILLSYGSNRNILIENCLFKEASGIYLPENHLVSIIGDNIATIKNNEFNNFRKSGINILANSNNWVIDSNHFYRTIVPPFIYQSFPDFAAIRITGSGHTVSNNFIGGQAPFCAGQPMKFASYPSVTGITAEGPSGVSPNIIFKNTITNINTTNTLITGSTSGYFSGIHSGDSYCIIEDNVIGNPTSSQATITSAATYIYGINVYGSKQAVIRNNTISGITNSAINGAAQMYGIKKSNDTYETSAYYNAIAIISKNKISNLFNSLNATATNSNVYSDLGGTAGININAGLTNMVEQNEIHNITVTHSVVSGITCQGLNGPTPSIVQRNRIYDLINTSNSVGSCCNDDTYNGIINGIGVDGETTGVDILNNQISITNNNFVNPVSIRGIYEAYGIQSAQNPKQRILYNTVYIGGIANQNGGSAAYFSLYTAVKTISNNIFFNERTGGTRGHFIYRFPTGAVDIFGSTKANNNLYLAGDTSLFAQISSIEFGNYALWKKIIPFDKNNYITIPNNIPSAIFFKDKMRGNLNLDTTKDISWYANGKALPFDGIAADFDSTNVRSTSITSGATDIGSDEFNTSTVPPELFVYGRHTLGGADTLTANGRIIAIIEWGNTGTLPTLGKCKWYSGRWPNDSTNRGTTFNSKTFNSWWDISATGGNNYTYAITYFYDSSMLGRIQNVPQMVLNKKQSGVDGSWQMLLPTTVDDAKATIHVSALTDFSEFTATDLNAPLGPANNRICISGSTQFKSYNTGSGFTYQWEVNNGTGFTSLVNNAIYDGSSDSTLSLFSVPSSFNGNQYRCVINTGISIIYSNIYVLNINNSWSGTVNTEWNNPLNWSCGLIPELNTNVIIQSDLINYPVINSNAICRNLVLLNGARITVNSGFKLEITGK